jgi:hypothetical protein
MVLKWEIEQKQGEFQKGQDATIPAAVKPGQQPSGPGLSHSSGRRVLNL